MATHSSTLAWSLVGYSPWGRKELHVTEHGLFTVFHAPSTFLSRGFTSCLNCSSPSFAQDWLSSVISHPKCHLFKETFPDHTI